MEPANPTPQTYFLSYSRTDEQFALRFARDLQERDVSVWIDQINIRPSEHWDRAIERAVRECVGLIVILSPRSVASDNVADEISFAIESGKRVLPVLIERCSLPLRITRMHMIDASSDYARALSQCVAEIKRAGHVADSSFGGSSANSVPVAQSDPDLVAAAEHQLTTILGPLATILTAKAAAHASSIPQLYRLLAEGIESEADRARFLAASPAATAPPPTQEIPAERQAATANEPAISAAELERLGARLVTYLGPMAALVLKREARTSQSIDELRERLSVLIPDERQRAEFARSLDR